MRYVGSVIPVVVADVEVHQSMEEGMDEGLCCVDGDVGLRKWKCMVNDSLLEPVGEIY